MIRRGRSAGPVMRIASKATLVHPAARAQDSLAAVCRQGEGRR